MNEKQIDFQLIRFMAHIEGIAEESQLDPPIRVKASDRGGTMWEFEYSPDWDSLDVLRVIPALPISVRLQDANERIAETEITDWALKPEWMKRFLQ